MVSTLERSAYLAGLYAELNDQFNRFGTLLREWHLLQGRIEMAEKAVGTTRDHLLMSLNRDFQEGPEDLPRGWAPTLLKVRFIGVRAADAILEVLKESDVPVTTKELLTALNESGFRFRTTTPLREIHAATMRHPRIRREGDKWVYEPEVEDAPSKEGEQAEVA